MPRVYTRLLVEAAHAESSRDLIYPHEAVIPLPDGRAIHCPAHPDPCSYFRIVHEGEEMMYWCSDEWREDPEDVMGALLGILCVALKK